MPKHSTLKSSHTGQFHAKRSSTDDLTTFRTVIATLKNHPEQLRSVVVKAGITTVSGNLKKVYKSR